MTLRILLVEDNPMNLELHRHLLETEGHQVLVAETAREFRAWVARGVVPDIVLMDILLPDAAGTDLLAELRSTAHLQRVPVVAVTAQALAGDLGRLLAAGFDEVITKPIDTRTFAAQIVRRANAASPEKAP